MLGCKGIKVNLDRNDLQRVFNFLDVNQDSKISINEFNKLEKTQRNKMAKRDNSEQPKSSLRANLPRTMCQLANRLAEKTNNLDLEFKKFD